MAQEKKVISLIHYFLFHIKIAYMNDFSNYLVLICQAIYYLLRIHMLCEKRAKSERFSEWLN